MLHWSCRPERIKYTYQGLIGEPGPQWLIWSEGFLIGFKLNCRRSWGRKTPEGGSWRTRETSLSRNHTESWCRSLCKASMSVAACWPGGECCRSAGSEGGNRSRCRVEAIREKLEPTKTSQNSQRQSKTDKDKQEYASFPMTPPETGTRGAAQVPGPGLGEAAGGAAAKSNAAAPRAAAAVQASALPQPKEVDYRSAATCTSCSGTATLQESPVSLSLLPLPSKYCTHFSCARSAPRIIRETRFQRHFFFSRTQLILSYFSYL